MTNLSIGLALPAALLTGAFFFATTAGIGVGPLARERRMPGFAGATGWLNSAPLDPESLRGKVVLVDFWTYTCINSLRPLPYLKAWAEKYRDAGLVVVGV